MAGVCKALFTTPSMEVGFREGVGKGKGENWGKEEKDGGREHRTAQFWEAKPQKKQGSHLSDT